MRPKPKGGKPKKPKGKGVACGNCFAARTLVQCPDGMQPIETIRVGQRVTTFSASERGQFEYAPEILIDPKTWSLVTVRQDQGEDGVIEADLLRPIEWFCGKKPEIGTWFEIDLEELGLCGDVEVIGVGEFPTVEHGPGRVVLSVFRHSHGTLGKLYLQGIDEPIEMTAGHPVWSRSRQDWVPVRELNHGESVSIWREIGAIDLYLPGVFSAVVFNLEIEVDHCYRAGPAALLVHNASGCVNNRKGFINYNAEDDWGVPTYSSDHYTGRPTGAHALITLGMLGSGTDASGTLIPPGWKDIKPSSLAARGHLIANQLGGSGSDPRNIIAIYQRRANTPVMAQCEQKIADAVRRGECVEMWVTVAYDDDSALPLAIKIKAKGDRGCFSMSASIQNTQDAPLPEDCQ